MLPLLHQLLLLLHFVLLLRQNLEFMNETHTHTQTPRSLSLFACACSCVCDFVADSGLLSLRVYANL